MKREVFGLGEEEIHGIHERNFFFNLLSLELYDNETRLKQDKFF